MFNSVESLLIAQAITTLIILLVFAVILYKRGLFNWNSAGFWSWSAFAIYFCLNPLASSIWNISHYRFYLSISGGIDRGLWIGIVSEVGILTFFLSYLFFKSRPIKLGLISNDFNWGMKLSQLVFTIVAIASFIIYRSYNGSHSKQFSIVAGRFSGQTTGYVYEAHMFIFFVVVSLMLSHSRLNKLLALLLSLGYVIFSFQAIWSRFTTISLVIALSLAITISKKLLWPHLVNLVFLLLLVGVLIIRGHSTFDNEKDIITTISSVPERIGGLFSSSDTAMLASWYAESFVKDEITGYDYGIPIINYVFLGPIPGRIFPQKYFLIDWLHSRQNIITSPTLISALYGAKSSLLGSFYSNGGIVGVIIGSIIFAFLCRKIDGMLHDNSPRLVRSAGICILSILWIVWGSSDYWCLTTMGTLILPAIVSWIFAPKFFTRPIYSYTH